jgi:hypothetical protein
MDSYTLLLYLHVLLFVYWLGADLGVLALALALKNSAYSYEQRSLLMRMSLTIDMVPRVAFATIAPVGLGLAGQLGLVSIPDVVTTLIWLLAAAWVLGEILAFRNMGKPIAMRFYMATGTIMLIACLGFTGYGLKSLVSGAPFLAVWLSLKVFLFGMVFLVSILMAVFYAPIEGILEKLREQGSTPEIEADICSHVNRGAFFTVVLFVLLATMGFLGLAKPF